MTVKAGFDVTLHIVECQMSIDVFNEAHEGIEYQVDKVGSVKVKDGQLTLDDYEVEDEETVSENVHYWGRANAKKAVRQNTCPPSKTECRQGLENIFVKAGVLKYKSSKCCSNKEDFGKDTIEGKK